VFNMKVQIDIYEDLKDLEVIIKCATINDTVLTLQKYLLEISKEKNHLIFYQNEKEFYFSINQILFFETSENGIAAHTKNDIYQVHHKLYELEEMLPAYFMRVSKSTILNTHEIYSITKNITSSSKVEFHNTHKVVYVSRNYYKSLKNNLHDSRL